MEETLEQLEKDLIIKSQEERVLRKRVEILRREKDSERIKNYLGKCYKHIQYNDKWTTFIYVNKLEEGNFRLNCSRFIIIYEDHTDSISCMSESELDFHTHYLHEEIFNELEEITKEQYLENYQEFLNLLNESIK